MPDVFGLNRRTVESLQAQEQEARFQRIATYTTLTANVVVTAIQIGSLQMQIVATHQLIDSDANALKILQYQFAKGYASRLDVAAQESQLAQASATLTPLVKQLAQLRSSVVRFYSICTKRKTTKTITYCFRGQQGMAIFLGHCSTLQR